MENIDYSIIIRTTGKAGKKYRALLDSINQLVPAPTDIIVVLPEGYREPDEKLGTEKFYFSQKGMVIQRMVGVEKCKTRYALICDDDVCFDETFVQKLYEPIKNGLGAFSAGPLYSFLPPKGLNAILCTIMASAAPTVFHKNRYVSVLKSTGYSYNRHLDIKNIRYYESQSLAWTCFFADIEALRSINFKDEIWLDSHGYSALDDQTMFYKAWLRGLKTIVVSNAYYEHLDAKTSTRNNKPATLYSITYNRVVFWHRFIYSMQENGLGRIYATICFKYRMLWMRLFDYIAVLRKRMTIEEYNIAKKGYVDGMIYIESEQYKQIPSVIA